MPVKLLWKNLHCIKCFINKWLDFKLEISFALNSENAKIYTEKKKNTLKLFSLSKFTNNYTERASNIESNITFWSEILNTERVLPCRPYKIDFIYNFENQFLQCCYKLEKWKKSGDCKSKGKYSCGALSLMKGPRLPFLFTSFFPLFFPQDSIYVTRSKSVPEIIMHKCQFGIVRAESVSL